MPTYRAFISYAHRYQEWVQTLQRNLERCLKHAGQPGKIFLDQVDLGSGRSWVAQLQSGVSKAKHFVLVTTPEALASPRAGDEWQGFLAARRNWHEGHLHVLRLVDSPLPPFLEVIQHVDFRQHNDDTYRQGLKQLLAGLLKSGPRTLPDLPPNLEIPTAPASTLSNEARSQLVAWVASILKNRVQRRAIASALGLDRKALDGHPSLECAASAAVVLATGDDDPLLAALRIADVLIEELEEEEPQHIEALRRLRDDLATRKQISSKTGLVGAWLRKMVRDHEKLVPYFQQRTELDLLDRVYVQLELHTEHHERLLPQNPRPGLERHLTVQGLLALDPAEHSWVTRRWVVLGDPGAGKTTLLRHLAATVARQSSAPWVPVFESLPRLMREPEWLLDRIARQMRRAGEAAEGLPAVLDRVAEEGRLLLLFDGLDEVPREVREDADAFLRQVSARWPRTPIVVTSRPVGYLRPGNDFLELELLPFDGERRRQFLARWFGRATGEIDTERAEAAAEELEVNSGLRELSSNPLYLTLMALLIEKGASPARHRTELYDQVFRLLLDGGHRPAGEPMECQDAVREVLRHLADAMTQENRDAESVIALEARLYQPEFDRLRMILKRVPRWDHGLRLFLNDLAERTGILGPHDGPDTDWRFWHRTFREALTAESLEQTLLEKGEAAVLEHAQQIAGDESRWAEPYALLVGRVKDPDALVRALVDTNRTLGLRAVATAQGLQDQTLYEILELSEEWKERQKVYARVPELVDDPGRSLALLDQLRRRTRNGNDLFFLEQTVAQVAEQWPDYQRSAEQLRDRLYDHIPRPPEELFRWIETPLDGRMELWREIPAGRFLMGSREDEEGRYDREGPHHEVIVASPFVLGAVPVTNDQYAAFDPAHKSMHKGDHHPVDSITWYEAMSFCRWLSQVFPGARLPTEEEWEWACRAGTQTRYWSGDKQEDLNRVGWYDENSDGRTHRIGEKPANPWGLYDVHGNVYEWTLSEWTDDYSGREADTTIDPTASPPDLTDRGRRVIRGGCCWIGADWMRAACRLRGGPGLGLRDQGFRVMLPHAPEPG